MKTVLFIFFISLFLSLELYYRNYLNKFQRQVLTVRPNNFPVLEVSYPLKKKPYFRNQTVSLKQGDRTFNYTIDSLGFRNTIEDYDYCKEQNCLCIIGSSHIWGVGLDDSNFFSTIVREETPHLNFSVANISPLEYLKLIEFSRKFKCKKFVIELQLERAHLLLSPFNEHGHKKPFLDSNDAIKEGKRNNILYSFYLIRRYIDFSKGLAFILDTLRPFLFKTTFKYQEISRMEKANETYVFKKYKELWLASLSKLKNSGFKVYLYSRFPQILKDRDFCSKYTCLDFSRFSSDYQRYRRNELDGHLNELANKELAAALIVLSE